MNTQTQTGGDIGLLGLGSVLVGSLPATLLTDDAPPTYTVEAVFSRRPAPEEITGILDDRTRTLLAEAGYPRVEVAVSDRRLEISRTTLEELRGGLSTVIADRLASISTQVKARQQSTARAMADAAAIEEKRAAAITALAQSVAFDTTPEREPSPTSEQDAPVCDLEGGVDRP